MAILLVKCDSGGTQGVHLVHQYHYHKRYDYGYGSVLDSEQYADEAVVFDLVGKRVPETDVSLAFWYLEKGAAQPLKTGYVGYTPGRRILGLGIPY